MSCHTDKNLKQNGKYSCQTRIFIHGCRKLVILKLFQAEKDLSMGESNTVASAYTLYRHLQQYCSHTRFICFFIASDPESSHVEDEDQNNMMDSALLQSKLKNSGKKFWFFFMFFKCLQ